MGTYLNPGNSGFAEMLRSDYVDKTGLIGLINTTIGTKKKLGQGDVSVCPTQQFPV